MLGVNHRESTSGNYPLASGRSGCCMLSDPGLHLPFVCRTRNRGWNIRSQCTVTAGSTGWVAHGFSRGGREFRRRIRVPVQPKDWEVTDHQRKSDSTHAARNNVGSFSSREDKMSEPRQHRPMPPRLTGNRGLCASAFKPFWHESLFRTDNGRFRGRSTHRHGRALRYSNHPDFNRIAQCNGEARTHAQERSAEPRDGRRPDHVGGSQGRNLVVVRHAGFGFAGAVCVLRRADPKSRRLPTRRHASGGL